MLDIKRAGSEEWHGLSTRSKNVLKNAKNKFGLSNITPGTIIRELGGADFRLVTNCGRKSILEIKEHLMDIGFNVDSWHLKSIFRYNTNEIKIDSNQKLREILMYHKNILVSSKELLVFQIDVQIMEIDKQIRNL